MVVTRFCFRQELWLQIRTLLSDCKNQRDEKSIVTIGDNSKIPEISC